MTREPAAADLRWLVGAMVVGLALRLLFGLAYWRDKPLTHDEQEYLVLAANLAAGRGFSPDLPGAFEGPSVDRFSRAPLYPVFLAGIYRATGEPTDRLPPAVPTSVKVVQSFIGVAGIWVVSRLAAHAGGARAGLLAAWLAAVHPPLVWSSSYALSEVVYSPLILAAALVLGQVIDVRAAPRGRAGEGIATVAAAGLLIGAAALVRSAAIAYLPFAGLWLAWRHRLSLALVLGVAAAIVILPWTFRNYRVHGRPILVAADGGVTFWTGNHPLARGEGDLAANPELKKEQRRFIAAYPGLSPEAMEPIYYRDAFRHIANDPVGWLGLELRKLFYTFAPIGPSYTLHSPRYYWGSVVPYLVLFPLAVAGVLGLRLMAQPPYALLLLALSSVVLCLVFFPQERFRIPVVDPTLIVGASCWLTRRGHGTFAETST